MYLTKQPYFEKVFKKVFRFPENLFQSLSIEMFKISNDCHIKTCQSLKRRAILKIPSIAF